MKEWTEYGFSLVTTYCKTDTIYQSLLQQCAKAEAEYQWVIAKLPPVDRACVERYISLCEELDHRMTELAYTYRFQK